MIDHHARAENLRFMADTGENLTGAARRLGITRGAVEEWCKDHGLRAELEVLRRRERREPGEVGKSEACRAGAMARWAS